eukprot:jgi/Mesen1/4583/ME000232S03831
MSSLTCALQTCISSRVSFETIRQRTPSGVRPAVYGGVFVNRGIYSQLRVDRLSRLNGDPPLRFRKTSRPYLVVAKESTEVEKIVATAVKTGKQGLASATSLVPEAVPRPVATAGVAIAGVLLATTIVKSLFSTLISFLVLGALGYGAFLYFTKGTDSSTGGGGSSSSSGKAPSGDPIEEARRIMDKYK